MNGKASDRSGRIAAGACLTLLACVLAWPSTASAGCTHSIAADLAANDGPGRFERLERAGALADAPATRPDRPSRCTSGMCSGSTSIPLAPAPPPSPLGETWAILEPLAPRPDPIAGALPSDPSRAYPSQAAAPIFHPPRSLPAPLAS